MTDLDNLKKRLDTLLTQAEAQGLGPDDPLPAQYVGGEPQNVRPDDPSVMVINVEDYPGLDPSTEEGKDQLSSIGFANSHTHPDKRHFLFKHKGKQIGQMIVRAMMDPEH
jgi:hypothetical protein